MGLNKEELQAEITKRNIYLENGINWTNDAMMKRLGDYYLFEHRGELTFGTAFAHSLDNVMLIDHYKHYAQYFNEMNDPLESEDWISELKNNGFRCLVVYSPEYGFEMFSRRESIKTFVNGVFTDKILFIKNGLIRDPRDYKGVFNYRFVIDCEAMVNSDSLAFDGTEYTSVEDFLQAVLGSLPEKAKNYQKTGHTIYFKTFDILYFEPNPQPLESFPTYNFRNDEVVSDEDAKWVYTHYMNYLLAAGFDLSAKITYKQEEMLNGKSKKVKKEIVLNNDLEAQEWCTQNADKVSDIKLGKRFHEKDPGKKIFVYLASLKNTSKFDIRKYSFKKRRQVRNSMVDFLKKNNLPFELIETEDTNKTTFAEEMIRDGAEGIILKNLHAPYFSALKSSRSHRACFKVKTSIGQLMSNMEKFDDFDVFITGFNKPKSKKYSDMIGALKCSIYLINGAGETVEHEIANIAGISHELKKDMTVIDENGEVSLNPKYLNKVIAIDGFSLSHKTLRFAHAKLKDNSLEMKNKEPIACTIDIGTLEGMIQVRGN